MKDQSSKDRIISHLRLLDLPQRQDSSEEQMRDLIEIANALKMYDAADALKDHLSASLGQMKR